MESKNIIYDRDEEKGIARITINRPAARNALNTDTRLELKSRIGEIENDQNIRVVIITGAGDKSFVSGADINDFKGATPQMMEERTSTLGQGLFTALENLRAPVIAMINGYCFGAGLEMAMCCDTRIASENAKFGQLEINIGIFPGAGGTQRLPRLIGWGRAKQMIYTGRIIDGVEAERIGLVDRVVPPDMLEQEVKQLAETIASKSPVIMSLAKKAINRGMYTDLAAGLAYEKRNFALCFATEDHIEGIAAFLEKRQPVFKGR
jgi:enoyl-CoA hydratase